MKKTFTILIAAIAAILMMTQPKMVMGQTTVTQTSFNTISGNVNSDTKVTYQAYKGGAGTDPATYSNAIRLYQISNNNYVGGYIVIGVPSGYVITSATIQSGQATTAGYKLMSSDPGNTTPSSFDVNNYSLSANTDYTVGNISTRYIVFGCFGTSSSNRLNVKKISITYQSSGGGSTPSISADDVQIDYNATSGSIAYTINNGVTGGAITSATVTASSPSNWLTVNGSNPYSSPISLTCTENPLNYNRVATVTLTYTYGTKSTQTKNVTVTQAANPNGKGSLAEPFTIAEAITFIGTLGGATATEDHYVKGIISQIDSYSSNQITYWISSDGTTTTQLEVYKGKGIGGASFSAVTNLQTGNQVTVKGKLKKYGQSTYEFDSNSSITSYVSKSSLTGFTYAEGHGPSSTQTINVGGSYLSANITVSLGDSSPFEISKTSDSNYTNSITLEKNASNTVTSTVIYIRLKSGLEQNNSLGGTITVSTSGTINKTVSLSGSVTGATYTLSDESGANGSIGFSTNPAPAGSEVTLTPTPASAAYYFVQDSWSFFNEGMEDVTKDIEFASTNVIVMPEYNLLVDATFSLKPTYAITCVTDPVSGGGTLTTTSSPAYEGQTVTLTYSAASGYSLSKIVITKTSDGSATSITPTAGANSTYTFTMPAHAVTATATFLSNNYPGSFTQYSGSLTEGDYLIVYNNGAMNTTLDNSNRFGITDITSLLEDNIITNPSRTIVWHIAASSTENYWTIYNAKENKYAVNTNGNGTTMGLDSSSSSDDALWKPTGTATYEFQNKNNIDGEYTARTLRRNGSSGFASYQSGTGGALTLYKYTPNVAPTWAGDFPTAANLIPNQKYELTVSGKASGFPTPVITLETEVASGYTFEDGVFTFSSASTDTYEFTFTATNIAGSASKTITITVAAPTKVNYYYSRNGVLSAATEITQGESATLDSGSNLDGGNFTFVGWTTDPNDVETPLAAGSSQTINNETIFYAVYSRTVSITEDKVVILDGEATNLTSTAQSVTISEGGFSYYASSAKYQALGSNPEKNISSGKTILIGKSGANLYNTTAFGNGITKFEIYANAGAAAAVTTGIHFSTSTITQYTTGDNTWESDSDGMGRDKLYVITDEIPSGAKYFWYQVTNDNNSQVQFRITYTLTHNDTKKFTRVFLDETASSAITISGPSIIPSGKYLNMDGNSLTSATAANLIIEDDAQLKTTSSSVMATYTKAIQKSTNNAAKWYTISTPVKTVTPATNGIVITSVTNLVNSDDNSLYYNLYRYNEESYQWEAYNPSEGHHTDFTALLNGQGYLYRNNGKILTFTGQVNVGNVSVPVSFASSNTNVKGFNLLGNPYSHNITLQNVTFDGDPFTDCYILNGNGGWNAAILLDNNGNIEPGQGFMVQAIKSGDATISQTIPTKSRDSKANGDFIKFTVANNEYEDVAYAVFDKGYNLTKINHRNADIQKIYIPQNGDNFAVASMADNTKSFNLNFKAMTTGRYTLSYKAKGEFSYLHVIDLLTGDDIDMLLEGEYNFIASQNDSENRFVVRLTYAPNYGEENEIFAYQNGSDILVSGYGELQVFDVLGRFVMSKNVNGSATISADALTNGVYVLRIVGTEIKTQKIVVR